jgi:integrase
LAYGSGLRRGEILNLTWADIDFANQSIHITSKKAMAGILEWEPKDHENRVALMSDETASLLADIQIQSIEGHAYIVISPQRFAWIMQHRKTDKPACALQTANNLVRDFNAIRRHAGVKKCTLHDLRRSAITNWAQKLPIQVVQQLAGHSDISTTRKYYLSIRSEDFVLAGKILNGILAETKAD